MLIWFVVLYLMLSIGLVAATRVHTAKDFAIAGRHLPQRIGLTRHRRPTSARHGTAADTHHR
jgi:hypothetical protein